MRVKVHKKIRKKRDDYFKELHRKTTAQQRQARKDNPSEKPQYERERVFPEQRREIARSQNMICHYCGCVMRFFKFKPDSDRQTIPPEAVTVEHLIPVSRGGTNDPENLVAACYACNTERNVLDVDHDHFLAIKRAQRSMPPSDNRIRTDRGCAAHAYATPCPPRSPDTACTPRARNTPEATAYPHKAR